MARKSQQPDRVQHHRMQAIDDPTAAFPIGALSQLVDQEDDSGVYGRSSESEPAAAPLDDEDDEADDGEEDDDGEPDAPSPQASPGTIQLGYLLLSLLGGGIAAALFAVVIVLLVLLL